MRPLKPVGSSLHLPANRCWISGTYDRWRRQVLGWPGLENVVYFRKSLSLLFVPIRYLFFLFYIMFHNYWIPLVIVVKLLNKLVEMTKVCSRNIYHTLYFNYDTNFSRSFWDRSHLNLQNTVWQKSARWSNRQMAYIAMKIVHKCR